MIVTAFRNSLGLRVKCLISKRLNFGQVLAEEPNMNKVDSFLIIIIVLLSGFFVVYKTAAYQFSGIDFERQKNEQLVRQIQRLELTVKAAELEQKNRHIEKSSRKIASVQPYEMLKPKKAFDANKQLMSNEKTAEILYKKAKLNCGKYKKEELCAQHIDVVVTQFPETRWAGESLILLSRLYLKARQTERANEVMNILSSEFNGDKEIQSKLAELKKGQF